MNHAVLASPALPAVVTLAAYVAAESLYARTRMAVLHPVLVAVLALLGFLRLTGLSYATYAQGTRVISVWLGPAVVALGVNLYDQRTAIVRMGRRMVLALGVGAVVGIVTAVGIARVLGASPRVLASLAPKSVTTPIAMAIAERAGGIPPLTAVVVIAVGVLGAAVGPPWLRLLRVRDAGAWGLAMGAAAHGVGTARAMEEGPTEGAASALAIGLNGLATAVLTPAVLAVLRALG